MEIGVSQMGYSGIAVEALEILTNIPQDKQAWPELITVIRGYFGTSVTMERSALSMAIMTPSEIIVRFLAQYGVDLNHSLDNTPPLIQACQLDTCPDGIIHALIENGARVNCTDIHPSNTLAMADLIQTGKHGTPLSYALKKKRISTIELLLSHGADFTHELVKSEMCRLCFDGFDSVVRPLLEAGFPVNDFCYIVDNGSVVREPQLRLCTLLQASILSGTSPVVRLLLKNGADPDKTSSFGDEAHDIRMDTTLPLIYAIMSSRLEIVPQLLDCGADVYKIQNSSTKIFAKSVMSTAMLAFLSSCGAENQLSRANLPIPAHIPRVIERSFLILEAIVLRSHGIDPMTEKALSKVRIDCKDSPYLPRVERLCKWVNRKSFICILHASGLLSQTGVVRQQNNQVLSVSSSSLSLTSRGQKRSLDTMESSECDVISRTDLSSEDARSMILAAKVFANLHRVIASFL